MKIYPFFLLLLLLSCEREDFNYEAATYKRITSDQDSIRNMFVEYVANADTSRKMRKTYWANGSLHGIAFIHGEKSDGFWKGYYDNGGLMYTATFKEGLRIDTQRYYDMDGKLASMRIYDKNGKHIKDSNVVTK